LPLYVGFGISSPAAAAATGAVVDGVIVGSALQRLVADADGADAAVAAVGAFLRRSRTALAGA
jgi:tryptophan synthase alpha chain